MTRANRRLPGEVASVLEREIRDGRHQPGGRMPTEAALATRFEVSRAAVREAIAELRRARLVKTHQGRGTFVAETLPEKPVFSLSSDSLDPVELRHVYEIRREVEAGAAALAAGNADEAAIAAMREAFAALERSVHEDRPGARHDLAFHRAIAEATGNRFFPEFLSFFYPRVMESITAARSNTARISGRAQAVQAEHRAILDAILAREPEEARAAMRVHLTNAMRRLGLARTDARETQI
ncbi:HTH-type transcriptional regulator LutR [wastewater metagenome]|uniref:HTH-type transcriptional regulator LutR n=2 Tax=unclassified sequences TaxID=12908 RepID=A0A5B8R8A8_9ZZZZ|nr:MULTISPECIES: FadR/GntR family transcriptional regulator [Arhodomonas]MCS4504242.1 FadR family transcriptional regulator [Arhodomonas aquaeolei]QEA04163.1 HTH-type transcriptional regulator LutR [uncultured organism]